MFHTLFRITHRYPRSDSGNWRVARCFGLYPLSFTLYPLSHGAKDIPSAPQTQENRASRRRDAIVCAPKSSPPYDGGVAAAAADGVVLSGQSGVDVGAIGRFIGADSLGYLSLTGMLEAIGLDTSTTCSACWTGKYPTLIASGKAA